jgi:hypothetical protein
MYRILQSPKYKNWKYTNEYYDNRSIHATYFERLCHIKEVLLFYKSGKGISWNNLALEFVGS